MTLETETILDRRRLRRKLGFWRGLAIVVLLGALGWFAIRTIAPPGLTSEPQIARITVSGLITSDRKQLQLLEKLAKADHVKGVIVFVNSPGGTTTGGEALYEGLRDLAKKKPVVAQFGTVAASAAYIAGLATDHIVARGNSITGSVGVIMQWPELTGLLDRIGIKMHEIKSGKLKAAPSPFMPVDEEARRVAEEMVLEGQKWFLGLVKERRKIDPTTVPGLVAGRVYSGRMALRHKLVDAIGGEDQAVEWLVKTRKLKPGLNVVDWKPETNVPWPLAGAMSSFFADIVRATLARLGMTVGETSALAPIGLDGLVSVWHPGKN
jgi:protease IV